MLKLPSLLGWQKKTIIWQLPYSPGTLAFLWLLDSESGFLLFVVFWPHQERPGNPLSAPGPELHAGGKEQLAGEQSLAYAFGREKGFPSKVAAGFWEKHWGFLKEGQGSEGL